MGRYAEHVYTDQRDIARLEALTLQLPDEAEVELTLQDGRVLTGIVSTRPVVQQFLGQDENSEGANGVLRLDDPAHSERVHLLWLDEIRSVRRLGSA